MHRFFLENIPLKIDMVECADDNTQRILEFHVRNPNDTITIPKRLNCNTALNGSIGALYMSQICLKF